MKPEFAITKNVQNFLSGIETLLGRHSVIPGMMLVYGEPGTGKSRTAIWWKIQQSENIPYIRATRVMTARAILEAVVYELGESPAYKTADIIKQIQRLKIKKPIIIDEIDYLQRDGIIEIVRDIHDMTDIPIIMIGMSEADRKIRRFPHLYDRISIVIKFNRLDNSDIKSIAAQICECKFDNTAIEYIRRESKGRLRRINILFYLAERIARVNKLETITANIMEGSIK